MAEEKRDTVFRMPLCVCEGETNKALFVSHFLWIGSGAAWFPKSALRPGNEIEGEGDEGTLVVCASIADKKRGEGVRPWPPGFEGGT